MAGRVSIPGSREVLLDQRGVLTPRWRRFFEEVSGQQADQGDILTKGPDGPTFDSGSDTAISEDTEFLEFWRT